MQLPQETLLRLSYVLCMDVAGKQLRSGFSLDCSVRLIIHGPMKHANFLGNIDAQILFVLQFCLKVKVCISVKYRNLVYLNF